MRLVQARIERYRQMADATLEFGDVTIFIGPNGAGKSTVLRALEFGFSGDACSEIVQSSGFNRLISLFMLLGIPLVHVVVSLTPEELRSMLSGIAPNPQPSFFDAFGGRIGLEMRGHSRPNSPLAVSLTIEEPSADTMRFMHLIEKPLGVFLRDKIELIQSERLLPTDAPQPPPGQQPQPQESLLWRLYRSENDADFGQTGAFGRFGACMNLVFPEIGRVKAVALGGTKDLMMGEFPSRWMGSGHRQVAAIAARVALSKADILCLEEPEVALHPALLVRVLGALRAVFPSKQFIVTTHAARLIAASQLKDLWECRAGEPPRRLTAEAVPALADSLGVRLADSLDYDLLLLVEGPTDRVAWNTWLAAAHLEGSCRAVDIGGFGNISYYANADYIRARRRRPIVCVALDGDVRSRPGGEDAILLAREFAKEMKGESFDLARDSLEDYLLHAGALGRALGKAEASAAEALANARVHRPGSKAKVLLRDAVEALSGRRFVPEQDIAAIAREMPVGEIGEDVQLALQRMAALSSGSAG